jgi:hypothetical protein
MTANLDLERRLSDFYASEAPQRAPDRVLHEALASIDSTPQRRVFIRAPWRFPTMNSYAKFAIVAVAVVAIGAVGLAVLRPGPSPGVGGPPADGPSVSPLASASPALTGEFTSERHGFSISYPTGWVARPATVPWTTSIPNFESTEGDVLYDPAQDAGHLWIMAASQPLNEKSGEQWVDDILTGLASEDVCELPREPVTIDGTEGETCASAMSAVSAGDRGYLILLYVSGDDPALGDVYDQTYFEQIRATVRLQPEDAVDAAASASP